MDQQAKAERFHSLHHNETPLRLLNAWDAGTARLFEASGASAIGTTSAGVAFALGQPDGQRIRRAEMIDCIGKICSSVDVPVSADIESGFGESAPAVAETVRLTIEAGAVGVNLEDTGGQEKSSLVELKQQVDLVHAVREAADATEIHLFINARTDVYWLNVSDVSDRLGLTIDRLRAYIAAGANGVFVPGLHDPNDIAKLATSIDAPLNILGGPGVPKVDELARLGVARVSVGSGPSRAALGTLKLIADEFNNQGSYERLGAATLSYVEANNLFV